MRKRTLLLTATTHVSGLLEDGVRFWQYSDCELVSFYFFF